MGECVSTRTMKKLFLKFKAIIAEWAAREVIHELRVQLVIANEKDAILQDELHLARLEVEQLNRKLVELDQAKEVSKSHVRKLWNFIAIRHRIHAIPENGTIIHALKKAEGR